MAKDHDNGPVLSKIDADKRQFISKLIGTTAFVAPVVASFAMDSMKVAEAASLNGSTF